MSELAALHAEVLADPDADAPRRVLADHLLEQGDPRGELIQVQCAAEALPPGDPQREVLEERAWELIAAHGRGWVRALPGGDRLAGVVFRRGFVEGIGGRVAELMPIASEVAERTPLRDLDVDTPSEREMEALRVERVAPAIERLRLDFAYPNHDAAISFGKWPHRGRLRHLEVRHGEAIARRVAERAEIAGLRSLILTHVDPDGATLLGGAAHLASLRLLALRRSTLGTGGVRAIAWSPHLTGLDELELDHIDPESARMLGDAPALAGLRRLSLNASRIGPEPAPLVAALESLTRLEELDLSRAKVGGEATCALLRSPRMGGLRRLALARGWSTPELVAAIAAIDLPALRHLAWHHGLHDAAVPTAIAASPGLDLLESLELPDCRLGDGGVIALARPRRLPALRRLDLRNTGCGPDGVAALVGGELAGRLIELDLRGNPIDAATVRALVASPLAARLRWLGVTATDGAALAPLLEADLPELRTLAIDPVDDAAALLLAYANGMPRLRRLILRGPITSEGATALAGSPFLGGVLWVDLHAQLDKVGQAALGQRFGGRTHSAGRRAVDLAYGWARRP